MVYLHKVLALQALGPEFDFPEPMLKVLGIWCLPTCHLSTRAAGTWGSLVLTGHVYPSCWVLVKDLVLKEMLSIPEDHIWGCSVSFTRTGNMFIYPCTQTHAYVFIYTYTYAHNTYSYAPPLMRTYSCTPAHVFLYTPTQLHPLQSIKKKWEAKWSFKEDFSLKGKLAKVSCVRITTIVRHIRVPEPKVIDTTNYKPNHKLSLIYQ